jgi:hypothetical protein
VSDHFFLLIFLGLTAVDYYFDIVQTATTKISLFHNQPELSGFLNPGFIRLAMLVYIIRWGWVVYWAISGSALLAIVCFVGFWLLRIALPVPTQFALPAVRHKISFVNKMDREMAQHLGQMVDAWERT